MFHPFAKQNSQVIFTNKQNTSELLRQDVEYLRCECNPRSASHVENQKKAMGYIQGVFQQHAPEVELQPYRVKDNIFNYVIARWPRKDTSIVVVLGAGTPGADDDASGVAGLLGVARIYAILLYT